MSGSGLILLRLIEAFFSLLLLFLFNSEGGWTSRGLACEAVTVRGMEMWMRKWMRMGIWEDRRWDDTGISMVDERGKSAVGRVQGTTSQRERERERLSKGG